MVNYILGGAVSSKIPTSVTLVVFASFNFEVKLEGMARYAGNF